MNPKQNRGFTLIEVLVALLIFSVGLLGMAGLMVVSVKTNHSAFLRTQASFLGQSMADRMRANMGQIAAYAGSYSSSTIGSDPCPTGGTCTPVQLVARDRATWSQQLVDSLPNPTATIACNGAPLGTALQAGAAPYGGLCTLLIQWDESSLLRGTQGGTAASANAVPQTFAWVFQP